jgi:hypothetical protein
MCRMIRDATTVEDIEQLQDLLHKGLLQLPAHVAIRSAYATTNHPLTSPVTGQEAVMFEESTFVERMGAAIDRIGTQTSLVCFQI